MKHITSKLLSLLLCLAMLMSMVPAAYAAGTEGTDVTEANGGASEQAAATTDAAKVGDSGFPTLAAALDNAQDGATVTLLADVSEDVTINKNITLDLGDKTLTNTSAGEATISVTGGAVTVKNGTVTGGASYYNIEVTKGSNANLTLEGVTATAGNTDSSMIDNWGTLTISSGNYSGGLNVVKSEEDSKLTIDGGKFTLDYAPSSGYTATILVYGDTTITGGEFIQNATPKWGYPQVVMTGVVEGYTAITKITGGTFTNKKSGDNIFHGLGKATSDNFEVSGGTFNKSIPDGYCADGFIPTKNADGTYGVKEGKYVAAVGSKKCETLADAIRLAAKGKTVKLLNDVSEDISVPANKEFKLDLNGHTLTNASGDTITVAAKANLTIQGEGTVDNVTHGKAAIYNNGTVTLNGGTYTRSLETGDKVTLKNTYYNILNHGIMTINNGVTVKQDGNYSSLVANGYYNYKDINAGERTAYIEGTGQANPKLIINGGNFSGGINTIKNDDGAELTIQDGTFRNATQYVVMNNNIAAINGGKFEGLNNDMEVVYTQYYAGGVNAGKLSITGGNFVGKITGNASANIKISNGVFSVQPDAKYLAPGYKAEQTNGVWVVKSGTNDAISAIDAALEAVKNDKPVSQEDTKKAVTDAVTAVKDIPNDKLTDTTTMDKLAKLEEAYKAANTDNAITVKVENADTVETKVTNNGVKNAALSADAGQTVTINVDKNTTDAENVADAIKTATGSEETPNVEALDITMKIGETVTQPKAPVVLTFELPEGKDNAQIYRIEGSTATKIPTTLNVNAESKRTISGTFDHFSTYGIQYLNATANENKYTLILQPNTREVSAGDTLTYTVSLRHDAGSDNDTISGLRFNLDANEGLKLNPSASKGFDNTVKFGQTGGNGNYQFNFVGTKTLQTNQTMSVGTLSYTVQDYGNNGDKVTAPVANTTVVTNSGTNVLPSLSVDSGDVTYHEIELTFVQPAGVSSKYYAKYNATGLYKTIADMINGTMAEAPTVTDPNSTEYRLIDTNWHAETDMDTIYDINSTKNIMSTTYVTNKQEIVKVTVPDGVTITSTPVTERSGEKYIDKGVELTFTVKNPDAGKKNKVTATIGNGTSEELTPAANGTYTVPGNKITGDVTITVTQELALTAADIKIFKTDSTNGGVQGYLPYSTYSGTRTLVLIKGAAGVNYTLGKNQPEIFALPEGAYKTDDGSTSYTHAVLMEPTDVVSEEAMLTALKDADLQITTDNVMIGYDWKTAGEGALDFQNVTTTYDFKSLTADNFKWKPTDAQLLKADVLNLTNDGDVYTEASYQTARDGHVSDEDVAAFMYLYAKLAK